MNIDFVQEMSIDPKETAEMFGSLSCPSLHHFGHIEELTSGASCWCRTHSSSSCHLDLQAPHLLVAGFPCSPFSAQREGRFAASLWPQLSDPIMVSKIQVASEQFRICSEQLSVVTSHL